MPIVQIDMIKGRTVEQKKRKGKKSHRSHIPNRKLPKRCGVYHHQGYGI